MRKGSGAGTVVAIVGTPIKDAPQTKKACRHGWMEPIPGVASPFLTALKTSRPQPGSTAGGRYLSTMSGVRKLQPGTTHGTHQCRSCTGTSQAPSPQGPF